MAINKFFLEYDDEVRGETGRQDDEVGPLGYSYEYDAAYRRAFGYGRAQVPTGSRANSDFHGLFGHFANQVALFESTGRPMIGVFQTLSAGKAGHFVPGITEPEVVSSTGGAVVDVDSGGEEVVVVAAGRPVVEVVDAGAR